MKCFFLLYIPARYKSDVNDLHASEMHIAVERDGSQAAGGRHGRTFYRAERGMSLIVDVPCPRHVEKYTGKTAVNIDGSALRTYLALVKIDLGRSEIRSNIHSFQVRGTDVPDLFAKAGVNVYDFAFIRGSDCLC